jgi:hypothetical protein
MGVNTIDLISSYQVIDQETLPDRVSLIRFKIFGMNAV